MKTSSALERKGFPGIGIAAAGTILLAVFSAAAFADTVKLTLSGDMEVPPVKTKASGGGTVTINPDMSVSGSITTTGLEATMAHIHLAAKGTNGPVIIPLTRNGEYGWTVPPGAKLTDAQFQAYKAGELYVNVHTAANKSGEIRGQLTP